MTSYEDVMAQVAYLEEWGACVAAETEAFNHARLIHPEMLEPNLENRLAYEAALMAVSPEVKFVLDKNATHSPNEELDAAEEAKWDALRRAEIADQDKQNAMARTEEAEELVRQLKKEVEQVYLADMLAREATQRAEIAEMKFLRLSTVLDTFLQERDAYLHARVWAKFQESMGE